MNATRVIVKRREYSDSVRLMRISEKLRGLDGVAEAILMMATDNNKRLLESAGFLQGDAGSATANDLVIAIRGDSETTVDAVVDQAETLLRERVASDSQQAYRTLDSALDALPGANVAVISVPGQYAASEARRALERGLHVMLFSDNVSVEDEVTLKQLGCEKNLLVMGPDCGTAIISGAGLGFANVVRRGSIGIVGASGTGIQEISVLVHRMGAGISHAIGTGGRDLKDAVGGLTMLHGIDLLEADGSTQVIVVTSKPPAPNVVRKVLNRLAHCSKPVVVNFLGGDPDPSVGNVVWARTLEETAAAAVRLTGETKVETENAATIEMLDKQARELAAQLVPGQTFLRGLFTGGTLGYEALLVLQDVLGDVNSNIPLRPELRLADAWKSVGNSLVDLGDDQFTQARAHPMIDPALREHRLIEEAQDPAVAVILADVVLGYGSHSDPAGSLANAIRKARQVAEAQGRHLLVVAAVCGTEEDLQGLAQQEEVLRSSGAVVLPTNAQASRLAGLVAQYAGRK